MRESRCSSEISAFFAAPGETLLSTSPDSGSSGNRAAAKLSMSSSWALKRLQPPPKNDGFSPLVYTHHASHTQYLMPRHRQIQPRSGPEKAFGIVLREIRVAAGLSQLDVYVKF